MVDACGTEPLNEFVIISTGDGFAINNLQFGFNPTNTSGGASNGNINDSFNSCGLIPGNPNVYTGCDTVIPLGPGDVVPANSYLILQTSNGANATYDFSDLCVEGACIYVVSNACTRTSGAFTNKSTGSPGPRSNNLAINGSTCQDNATFNTQDLISNADGNYFIPPGTYGVGSTPCVAPPIAPAGGSAPVFDPFEAICIGESSPLPTVSNNGIEGQWVPEFNATETTTYTFIPNAPTCGNPVSVTIEVISNAAPVFSFETELCEASDENFPNLPVSSDNGITGSWNPSQINSSTTVYTFTPDNLSCSNVLEVTINFETAETPQFNLPDQVCQGSLIELPNESINGILGSWSPAYNAQETTTYTFTAAEGICASQAQVTITVVQTDLSGIEALIPDDLQLSCDADLPPLLLIDPDAFCGVGSIQTETISNLGDCEGALVITRLWQVLDEAGNLISAYQQITEVLDTTAPEFIGNLPEDMVLSCDDEWPSTPDLMAIDNCSTVSLVVEELVLEDPECPQNFSLQISYTATDDCGNATTHEQTIQFRDDQAPIFEANLPEEVFVDCGEEFPVIEPNVTDACSDTVSLSFTDDAAAGCEAGKTTIRTWVATDACGNSAFYTVRFIENCEPSLYEGISPNNDGLNDYLVIELIDCYPDNQLQVFNRNGTKVKTIDNYNNASNRFDGSDFNGKELVTGTYFYVLKYREDVADAYRLLNGWIYISR